MAFPARVRAWARNLSLARKVIAVIMGVTSAALVLAGVSLVAYDRSAARNTLARDIGVLADVVGETSTAAVSFDDSSGALETLHAVAVNKNVRLAAIIKDGAVFARFDRQPTTAQISIATRIDPEILRQPTEISTFDHDSLKVVRPIRLAGKLIGGVYVESDLDGLHDRLRRLNSMIALVLLSALGIAFVLSSRLERLITGPVLRLTEITQLVSRDKNYDIRAEKTGQDEVGVLIDRFNEMLSEIQRRDIRLLEEERARAEELELRGQRANEANRLKSEFVANMSHELRTPLNSIIGFAELMYKGKVGPVSDEHAEYLGDILTSSKHLLQLINDVLDLAKVESGKMEFRPEPVDLAKLAHEVRDILRGLADSKRLRVDTHVDADVLTAVVDPARLKQILYNYLSNAIKFTPERGEVHVRISREGLDFFRIDVQDTGPGIRAEDLAKLFVEFEQLESGAAQRHQGTGLGLALTKRLAEAQGGRVAVNSTPGAGSTFSAILPRVTKIEDPTGGPAGGQVGGASRQLQATAAPFERAHGA
jgi:signal transduction histidine kinase